MNILNRTKIIPSSFLQNGEGVYIYIYIYISSNSSLPFCSFLKRRYNIYPLSLYRKSHYALNSRTLLHGFGPLRLLSMGRAG